LVVEANGVLSDPQRRERYDLGEDEDGMNGEVVVDLEVLDLQ